MLMDKVIESVLQEIEARKAGKASLLLAIDGRCAAGKTTLASGIQSKLQCNVIHMDHFYLRPEQRTKARMQEPGGNVDRERFLDEVLLPLTSGKVVKYRPYDCHSNDFGDAVCLESNAVSIIEGSYACHPELVDYYDLRVFLSVSPEEQTRRILQREGVDRTSGFMDKWIPLEESYFAQYRISGQCDLVYMTD